MPSRFLQISIGVSFLAVSTCVCLLVLTVRADLVLVPRFLADTQRALLSRADRLQDTVDRLPDRIIPPVVTAATGEIRHATDGVLGVVKESVTTADARLESIQGQVDRTSKDFLGVADAHLAEVTATVAGLRTDLKPTLDNVAKVSASAADITTHINAALPPFTDCAYLDENGEPIGGNVDCVFNRFQGSSKAFERTMEAVAKAAPQIADSAVGTGKSVTGIAADIHTATSDFVKPKTFWQKLKAFGETAGKLAARFI